MVKFYEGMFLFNASVGHDWPTMEGEVRRLCDRVGATLHACVKFDDRKLAYEVDKCKRGTYVLAYFDAPPERMRDMERDANLSESVIRSMFLRPETPISTERLEEIKKHPADQPLMPAGSDRREERYGDRDRGYGDRGYGDRGYGDRGGFGDRGPRREEGFEGGDGGEGGDE